MTMLVCACAFANSRQLAPNHALIAGKGEPDETRLVRQPLAVDMRQKLLPLSHSVTAHCSIALLTFVPEKCW